MNLLGFSSKLALIQLLKGGLGLLCQVLCNRLHLGLESGETLLQCGLILGLCLNSGKHCQCINLICTHVK